MTAKQKNFVKGAAILGIAGLICKVIGAVFRIPLSNAIGTQGMANYQAAYPLYAFLLVISSAGLPTAISKMVSERVTKGDYRGAHFTFQVAYKVLLIVGVITSVLLFAASPLVSKLIGLDSSMYSFMAIAPALFFVSILSAYRGYFQGLQMMTPTALTQIVEQVGKLAVGLSLASLMGQRGPQYGAAGALIGVTVSEVLALIVVIIMYNKNKSTILRNISRAPKMGLKRDFKSTAKKLFVIAIPITIGACIMPLVSAIDSAVVMNSLQSSGFAEQEAASMFGVLTGNVNPLINMPAVLSLALAMSLVPAIAESKAAKNARQIKQRSSFGLKLALMVGLPASMGFFILAGPILQLLYTALTPTEMELATHLLEVLSIAVIFLTLLQTMTGILQGMGKPMVPVINLLIGAVVKVVVSIVMIRMPEVNIMGAAYGTLACYGIAAILDLICMLRYTKCPIKLLDNIIKPILATAIMTVVVHFVYQFAYGAIESNTISTLVAIVAGVIVYAICILLLRTIKREDAALLPGGRRLEPLMLKLHIWK